MGSARTLSFAAQNSVVSHFSFRRPADASNFPQPLLAYQSTFSRFFAPEFRFANSRQTSAFNFQSARAGPQANENDRANANAVLGAAMAGGIMGLGIPDLVRINSVKQRSRFERMIRVKAYISIREKLASDLSFNASLEPIGFHPLHYLTPNIDVSALNREGRFLDLYVTGYKPSVHTIINGPRYLLRYPEAGGNIQSAAAADFSRYSWFTLDGTRSPPFINEKVIGNYLKTVQHGQWKLEDGPVSLNIHVINHELTHIENDASLLSRRVNEIAGRVHFRGFINTEVANIDADGLAHAAELTLTDHPRTYMGLPPEAHDYLIRAQTLETQGYIEPRRWWPEKYSRALRRLGLEEPVFVSAGKNTVAAVRETANGDGFASAVNRWTLAPGTKIVPIPKLKLLIPLAILGAAFAFGSRTTQAQALRRNEGWSSANTKKAYGEAGIEGANMLMWVPEIIRGAGYGLSIGSRLLPALGGAGEAAFTFGKKAGPAGFAIGTGAQVMNPVWREQIGLYSDGKKSGLDALGDATSDDAPYRYWAPRLWRSGKAYINSFPGSKAAYRAADAADDLALRQGQIDAGELVARRVENNFTYKRGLDLIPGPGIFAHVLRGVNWFCDKFKQLGQWADEHDKK